MLNVSQLTKIIGGEALYSGATFQINPGEKVGLVGPNGAGKTTLFRMIIGEDRYDEGQISMPDQMRLAYFSQNVGEMKGKTALQEVIEGDKKVAFLQKRLKELELEVSNPDIDEDQMMKFLDEMGEIQTDFEKVGGYDLE
ncbi:MAG: glycosyl transferase family 1, partial [Bdellovibrio sp. CG_4_9_14_3_um_filter_39_7]